MDLITKILSTNIFIFLKFIIDRYEIFLYIIRALEKRNINGNLKFNIHGVLAQLGEHLPCTQGVKGSNPLRSTIYINQVRVNRTFFLYIIVFLEELDSLFHPWINLLSFLGDNTYIRDEILL